MRINTEILNIRISKEQKQTLDKLKDYNVNVAQFVRNAIKEKLEREKVQIIKDYNKSLDICPF
jgi:post-segregation antitoxin (ccd killing protein)